MLSKDSKKEYSMFYPRTKAGLLSDYPELRKVQVLAGLNRYDILFCWYYACKSSPFIYEEDPKERTMLALEAAYGNNKADRLKGAYLAGNFSEKVRAGIHEMAKFQIGPRVRAKLMVENIMTNYESLVNINPTSEFIKDGETDWTKKKAYIDACATISKNLPTLISQSEGSFGVTEDVKGDVGELDAEDLIDAFHESQ